MDTPATESNAVLSINQAANLFGGQPEEQQAEDKTPAATEPEKVTEAPQADAEPEKVEDAAAEEVEKVTIEVDGKTVELTKAELAEHYKNGLRQADYTKKTMEAAEVRKTADAEAAKAREERQRYAQGLQQTHAALMAAIQEQSRIDWDALLQQDPQEYLKQKHLLDSRQAKLQETNARGQQLAALEVQDRLKNFVETAKVEHQATLDKLPEWKDQKKAAEEKKLIAEELISRGFEPEHVYGQYNTDGSPKLDQHGNIVNPGLLDHRILLLARDAMLYRQTMSKAQAAAKKVSQLPQKVERPGGGEVNATDGRTAAMKRLAATGSIRDAARVFENL